MMEYLTSYGTLAVGLCLWLTADIIWAVYQIVLEIFAGTLMADFVWFLHMASSLSIYIERTLSFTKNSGLVED